MERDRPGGYDKTENAGYGWWTLPHWIGLKVDKESSGGHDKTNDAG